MVKTLPVYRKRGEMMVYPNLAAEMARRGISSKDIASVVGKTPDTVNKWMNGKGDFPIGKAFAVQSAFFPGCSITGPSCHGS